MYKTCTITVDNNYSKGKKEIIKLRWNLNVDLCSVYTKDFVLLKNKLKRKLENVQYIKTEMKTLLVKIIKDNRVRVLTDKFTICFSQNHFQDGR